MATRDRDADLRDRPPGEATPDREVDLEGSERKLQEVLATLRDSDVDLHDYMPDMATIAREAHPARAEEKLRQASLTPLPIAAAGASVASAPSPWAQGALNGGAIDKSALPSAMMPSAMALEKGAGAGSGVPLKTAPALETARKERWVAIAKVAGAVIAVFAPLTIMYVLLVPPKENGASAAPTEVTSALTVTPSATAPAPSGEPSALPTAATTTSATAVPAPPIAPPLRRPGAAPKGPKRGGAIEAPQGESKAPSPPATATPTATIPPELLR
jgi:hypothetical protein